MTVVVENLYCYQGATFSQVVTWYDADGVAISLVGYTAKMYVKRDFGTASIITLTTENSRISLGGVLGTITITISSDDTAALTPGEYIYDIKLISGGSAVRIAQGQFIILPQVSV